MTHATVESYCENRIGTESACAPPAKRSLIKIRSADGNVAQKAYQGITHEYFGMGAVHSHAKDAEARSSDALKKAFSA